MSELFDRATTLARESRWDELLSLIKESHEVRCETDVSGRTLFLICAGQPGSSTILRALVLLGADPNVRSGDGSNAFGACVAGGTTFGLSTIPELHTLLHVGANPNVVADCGMPALHWAIAQNRLDHAKILLEHGVDTTIKTSDSPPESATDIASRIGSVRALALLNEKKPAG